MQWKSIADDGMPDAPLVLFCMATSGLVTSDYYVLAQRIQAETVVYITPKKEIIEVPQAGILTMDYTHYLILEPPEVE